MYVAFPSELRNGDSGIPDLVYVALLDTLATALFNNIFLVGHGITTATLVPVIYSNPAGLISYPTVTNWRSNRKWGTQRRRGSYGRPNARP